MAAVDTETLPEVSRQPAIDVDLDPAAAPASAAGIDDLDRRVQLARRLAETRVVVDRVLDTVSEARLEARRLVTKDLGVDPRPELLNTIVKIACDSSHDGLRRELPRHLLTLHAVIEHELARLLDAPEPDADTIRDSLEVLPELLGLARRIQEDIASAMDSGTLESRDYLLQVCNSLVASKDRIAAGRLLAPRMELFARAAVSGDLREAVPVLQEDELRVLNRLFQLGLFENAPARVCLNSIALRSLMCEDMARWEAICEGAGGPDESVLVEPELLERMGRQKDVFHFISERLQAKQDAALQAGLPVLADEVRAFRQNLFATYIEFAPALRDATAGRCSVKPASDESALLSLLDATVQADAATEHVRANALSKEELYLRALSDMRRPDTAPLTPYAAARRSERRRLRALIGTAVALAAICAVLYVPKLLAPTPPPVVSVADFAPTVTFVELITVGGTMYARVSDWSWEDLAAAEQRARIEELGEIARTRGVESVFLADEDGRELGLWSPSRGATLN